MRKPATAPQIKKYIGRDGKSDPLSRRVVTPDLELVLTKRSRFWYTRFMFGGKRIVLNLRSSDLQTAAVRAVAKAGAVLRGDWEDERKTKAEPLTIGGIIEIYLRDVVEPKIKTRRDNAASLRTLLRTALGIKRDQQKLDGVVSEPSVDNLPVKILDHGLVRKYQKIRLPETLREGTLREAAKRSADAMLIQARSIFKRDLIADNTYPNLPDLTGFIQAPKLKGTPDEFDYSLIEPYCNLAFSRLSELKESDPAAYLLARLCICFGLRSGEAREARKTWVIGRPGCRQLQVAATDTFLPKGRRKGKVPFPAGEVGEKLYREIKTLSDDSEYIVPCSTAVYQAAGFFTKKGNWVEPCWRRARESKTGNERKHGVARRINQWLSAIEVGGVAWPFKKKLHEFRRWYGAQIASQHGLFHAQKLLRHADASTTNRYYADLVDKQPDIVLDFSRVA